jgi:hypothetical protein
VKIVLTIEVIPEPGESVTAAPVVVHQVPPPLSTRGPKKPCPPASEWFAQQERPPREKKGKPDA